MISQSAVQDENNQSHIDYSQQRVPERIKKLRRTGKMSTNFPNAAEKEAAAARMKPETISSSIDEREYSQESDVNINEAAHLLVRLHKQPQTSLHGDALEHALNATHGDHFQCRVDEAAQKVYFHNGASVPLDAVKLQYEHYVQYHAGKPEERSRGEVEEQTVQVPSQQDSHEAEIDDLHPWVSNACRFVHLPEPRQIGIGAQLREPRPHYTAMSLRFGALGLARDEFGGRTYQSHGRLDRALKVDMGYWKRRHYQKFQGW